jgi:hypothetical protein
MQACARLQPRTPDDPLARRQQKSKNNEKATNSNKKAMKKARFGARAMCIILPS